jgi:hypothetical protein
MAIGDALAGVDVRLDQLGVGERRGDGRGHDRILAFPSEVRFKGFFHPGDLIPHLPSLFADRERSCRA